MSAPAKLTKKQKKALAFRERKGKGKAIDRSKKDKGKGKAKEVTIYYILSPGATTDMRMCSNHTLGRHHTLARGTLFRRTRRAG